MRVLLRSWCCAWVVGGSCWTAGSSGTSHCCGAAALAKQLRGETRGVDGVIRAEVPQVPVSRNE